MLENSLYIEQRQTISAGQVQSLEILSYTNQELEDFMMNEYLENPMLENTSNKQDELLKDLEQLYEKGVSYKEQYIRGEEEDPCRKSDVRAKDPDELQEFLLGQLHRKDFREDEWKLISYLIQCLDEKGFFTCDLNVISEAAGCSRETVERCLAVLKDLEPAGIFSKDLSECLIKQLQVKGNTDEKLFAMVERYMPEILEGHIGLVTRKLNISTAMVKEYIHLIGSLNPRPIMNMAAEAAQYIVPDILAAREGDSWVVSLNDHWMGVYKYNDYYIQMMQNASDTELQDYFHKKLERARFIVNCVEQRRTTLIKVVETILEIQDGYFRRQEALRPMSLEDVAKRTGMHLSTISRAIRGKYLQYKKTVLIKDLFSGGLENKGTEEEISVDHIKARLKELITNEDKGKPLSDQQLAECLKKQEITISRRTVAKYRTQMGILDSRQRMYY